MKAYSSSLITIVTVVTLSLTGALTGCVATKPSNSGKPKVVFNAQGVPNYYRVKSGDTVGKIAKRYRLNYRYIGRINRLDSQYRIYTGQWLKLWESKGVNNGSGGVNANGNPSQPRPPRPINPSPSASQYIYPSNNTITKTFGANGAKGMWFAGRPNDPVYASQAGTVIYAGNGLTEYGNLVIIRHTDELVTAYAHNSRLLVREGAYVKRGQRIATMGKTGNTSKVALEFQIRRNGTPVNPMLFIR